MFVGSCFLFCVLSPDRTVLFFHLCYFVFRLIKLTWTRTTLHFGPILHIPHQTRTRIVTVTIPGSDASSQDALDGAAVKPFEDLRTDAKSFSVS